MKAGRFEAELGRMIGEFILSVADHDLKGSLRLMRSLSRRFHPFDICVYMAVVIGRLMETIKGDQWRDVLNYELLAIDIDQSMTTDPGGSGTPTPDDGAEPGK